MFKLKRKAILVSSIMAPVLPIIAVVSCNHEDEAVTSEDLNKEAEGLSKANFLYDEEAFDATKKASHYSSPEKVSGSALSKDTELTATKIEVVEETKLKITYKLKNGDVSSEEQEFTYPDFKVEEVEDVKSMEADLEAIKAVKASNDSKVLIATLKSQGSDSSKDIAKENLDYIIVSVKKDGAGIDIKESFEVEGDKLNLLAKKELASGTYEFKITSQAKGSETDPFSLKFDIVIGVAEIVKDVASIDNANESSLEAVKASNGVDLLLSTLISKDSESSEIDKTKLSYEFTSVKKDDSEDDLKAKFKIDGGKLYLLKSTALEDGTYTFVITSKVTGSSAAVISETFEVGIEKAKIKAVKNIKETLSPTIRPIVDNAKKVLIATLVSKDSDSTIIDKANLDYVITSVKKGDEAANINGNFEIIDDKLYLSKNKALPIETYVFVITSKVTGSSAAVISKTFEVGIVAIKDVNSIVNANVSNIEAVKADNVSDVLLSTLTSKDESSNDIDMGYLDYKITLVKKGSDMTDIKAKFKIDGGKLYLLKSIALDAETYSFEITSKIKDSVKAAKPKTFTVVIKAVKVKDVVSIDKSNVSNIEAVKADNVSDVLLSTLTSQNSESVAIDKTKLTYEVTSVKKDGDETDIKAKFKIDIDKLYLKKSIALVAGTYTFVITSKVTGSSAAVISKTFEVVIVAAS